MDSQPLRDGSDAPLPLRDTTLQFGIRHLGPWRDHAERAPTRDACESVVAAARAAGILSGERGAGCLWAESARVRDSLAILDIFAAQHAGLAYHLHQLALGEWLAARIGLAPGEDALVPWIPDGPAIAEDAMVHFLVNGVVEPSLATLLPGPGVAMHWHCADAWDALFVPVVIDGTVRLCLVPRQAFADGAVSAQGLDGISLCRARLPGIALAQAPPRIGADLMAELVGLNALGLVAIALGVVRDAQQRAHAQALRRGSASPRERTAVRGWLARQESALDVVETLLSAHERVPGNLDALRRTFSHRLVAHRLLCNAASAALRTSGGPASAGDVGLARAVRDCNRLRALAGSPADLGLFVVRAMQAAAA